MVEQEDMSSNERNKTQQSRIVAGVSVRSPMTVPAIMTNCFGRRSRRTADRHQSGIDDFSEHYDRISELIDAYIHSPEGTCLDGTEAPTSMLMCRLATCIADVIPVEQRPDHHQRERKRERTPSTTKPTNRTTRSGRK